MQGQKMRESSGLRELVCEHWVAFLEMAEELKCSIKQSVTRGISVTVKQNYYLIEY